MKYPTRATSILVIFLSACGSIPDAPTKKSGAQTNQEVSASKVLSHTESFDEESVKQAAATLLKQGASLEGNPAEECWKSETPRPNIREACMLAWSAGNSPSEFLEGELLANAHKTRGLSLALIRKKNLVSRLPFSKLMDLLKTLENDPAWVRAIGIETWLRNHASLGLVESNALWQSLKYRPHAEPASAHHAFRVAHTLGPIYEEELLTEFCALSNSSFAQTRCWRFLSAIVDPITGNGLDKTIRALLPSANEDSWVLFARSFPKRIRLFQLYR